MLFSLKNTTWQRLLPFCLIYMVHIIGYFLDVLEVDSAQYAEISREMAASNEWLQVKQHGVDYLDKPPLLFWLTALAYKIFGVSTISFRLFPSLLSFLGAYATYRLAKLYYNEEVAYLAALILASSQALFLMNHDLRTDNLLTTFVAFALWQLGAYLQEARWKYLIGGFVGVGLAMLAKGPIGLVIPVLTFGMDVLSKRQWQHILRWQYLVGICVVAVLLLPMSWGLYQQFDMHPEKTVNGLQGVSGLRFYYWTQSFGRITGENVWNNNPDPFFLVHTTLWSFLPWTVFLLVAYWKETMRIIKQGWQQLPIDQEVFVWWGFTLTFLALSRSKYQLNHYIYPIYSLAAIMTAKYIVQWASTTTTVIRQWLTRLQCVVLGVLSAILLFLGYCFPLTPATYWVGGVALVGFVAAFYFVFSPKTVQQQLLTPYFCAIIAANTFLNGAIYPALFQYQSESQAAYYLKEQKDIRLDRFFVVADNFMAFSMDFTLGQVPRVVSTWSQIPYKGQVWVYCADDTYQQLKNSQPALPVRVLKSFEDFHVSELTLPFLLPASRKSVTKTYHILEISL